MSPMTKVGRPLSGRFRICADDFVGPVFFCAVVTAAFFGWRAYAAMPREPDFEELTQELLDPLRNANDLTVWCAWENRDLDPLESKAKELGASVSRFEFASPPKMLSYVRALRPYPPLFHDLSAVGAHPNHWGETFFLSANLEDRQAYRLVEIGQSYEFPTAGAMARGNMLDGDFYCVYVTTLDVAEGRREDVSHRWYLYGEGNANGETIFRPFLAAGRGFMLGFVVAALALGVHAKLRRRR